MARRLLVLTPFVVAGLTCLPIVADAARAKGGACAAFAGDRTSATATYDEKSLSLDITYTSGRSSHLTARLLHALPAQPPFEEELAPETCRVFFDSKSDLIAVGISPDSEGGEFLEVLVANVRSSTWVHHFDVKPLISLDSPALRGFLENTDSLVITEQVERTSSEGQLYGSFLFSPTGDKLSTGPLATWSVPEKTRRMWNFHVDASRRRLWVLPCLATPLDYRQRPFCSISSSPLTGQDDPSSITFNPSGHGFNRLEVWMVPHVAVTPDANTILIAETVFRVDTIWRVDMREQTMQRLVVPRHAHFPNSDWSENATLSPDGQIMAVSFDQNTGNFPFVTEGAHWNGKHIAIVRVQPLGLVTLFPPGGAQRISAFAVDHQAGKIILLTFNDKRWQRYEFGDQAQPN